MLIATFLLALILLSIAPLFITSVKANYSANEYTSIHNIARDKLEQLMSLPFNDPAAAARRHGHERAPPTCRRPAGPADGGPVGDRRPATRWS